jgi:hypothetical protein
MVLARQPSTPRSSILIGLISLSSIRLILFLVYCWAGTYIAAHDMDERGPGSSSMIGVFTENGPCGVVELGQGMFGTKVRDWRWDRGPSILYID